METPGIPELSKHLNDRGRMIWVDLEDPTDEEAGVLGGIFGFHVLAAEDCIQGRHLPKVDTYDDYLFSIFHAVETDRMADVFATSNVSIFIGDHFLVTHHQKHVKGIFDTRGQVAKNPGSLLRSPDWLLHSILDAMVDNYLGSLEALEGRIQSLDVELLKTPSESALESALILKREVFHLHRVGKLQQRILADMANGQISRIADENSVYYRDIYDHLVLVTQKAESYRDILSGTLEIYSALVSRRMDRAIRTLTVVTASILPPTLLAGILQVNPNMLPGLSAEYLPIAVWGAALFLILLSFAIFKNKRWF